MISLLRTNIPYNVYVVVMKNRKQLTKVAYFREFWASLNGNRYISTQEVQLSLEKAC